MQTTGGNLRHCNHILRACALLALCTATERALADETPAEQATTLFNEALQLMQSDHCQDAVPMFVESQRLDPAAATLANLATCYVRLGKTGSAYETYRAAARAAILENKPELRKKTDKAAADLNPLLTRLRVVPVGSGELPEIRINGQLVEDVRNPVPLDPGETLIEATAPGHAPWRRTVNAQGSGTLLVVEVPDLLAPHTDPAQVKPSATPVARTATSDTSKSVDWRPYAIVATGIGVVGVAVGTGFAVGAKSKQNDSNAYCDGTGCTAQGIDLREQAQNRAEIATWTFGLGLASLTLSGALWYLSSRQEQRPQAAKVSPWVALSHQSVGIGIGGNL